MRLSLLGTGDAAGMPWYGCDCARCEQVKINPQLHRGPACALLESAGKRYLIDAGLMDICQRFAATDLQGILLTHFHPDHVQGLLHLRWGTGKKIPVYCPPDSSGCADLFKHPGILDFQPQRKFDAFDLGELSITPLPMIHSKPTFGYLIDDGKQRIAYLLDTHGLPPRVEALLGDADLDVMVMDTSAPPGVLNKNHNNLDDTLILHQKIGARKTVLTHIGHDFDCWLAEQANLLPADVVAGFDGYLVNA